MQPLIERIRKVSYDEGVHIAILADIQGPKLRIGKLADEGVLLVEGKQFTITTRDVTGSDRMVHSPY